MRYLMFYCEMDRTTGGQFVEKKVYDDFEEMMQNFTYFSCIRKNVLVIEPDTKKVVCHYNADGKVLFNKILLDGTIKTVGEQTLSVKLHPTVTVKFNLKIEV